MPLFQPVNPTNNSPRTQTVNYVDSTGTNYFGGGPRGVAPGGGVVGAQMTMDQYNYAMDHQKEYMAQPEAHLNGPVTVMHGDPGVRVSGRPYLWDAEAEKSLVRQDPNVSFSNTAQVNNAGMQQGMNPSTQNYGNNSSGANSFMNSFQGILGSLGGMSGLTSGVGSAGNSMGIGSTMNNGYSNQSNGSTILNNGSSINQQQPQQGYAMTPSQQSNVMGLSQLQNDFQQSYDPNGMQQLSSGDITQMIQENPMYKAQFDSGLQAIQRQYAAGGSLASGQSLAAAQNFGTQLAGSVYQALLGNLSNLSAQTGSLTGQYSSQLANNASTLYNSSIAPAQARSSASLNAGNLQGQAAIQNSINKTQASIATAQNMTNSSIASSQSSQSGQYGLGQAAGALVGGFF